MTSTPVPSDQHAARAASHDLGSWFGRHTAIATAVAGGGFLLFKTYAVAHYSVTTTLGLLSTAPAAVLVGSVAFFVYPFLPLVAVALGTWLLLDIRRVSWVTGWFTAGLIVVIVLFSSWLYLAGTALIGAAALWMLAAVWLSIQLIYSRRADQPPPWATLSQLARRGGVLVAAGLLVFGSLIMADKVWLPAELLTFENDPPTIGYVLTQEGGQTTFLRASDRALIRVPGSPETSHTRFLPGYNAGEIQTSGVVGRRICHWETPIPGDEGPLVELLRGKPYASPNLLCTRILCRMYVEDLEDGDRDIPLNGEDFVEAKLREMPGCETYDEDWGSGLS